MLSEKDKGPMALPSLEGAGIQMGDSDLPTLTQGVLPEEKPVIHSQEQPESTKHTIRR